jgi:DNA-binding transcriptional regulator YiaG
MGAFVGSEVAGYINHMANMDAATGRFAKTIGTAVENLSTWQNMIRMRGGDAGAATSVLSGLQQQIESVRQGSGMFEGGFATLLNRSGATLRDDADTTLRKIRGYIAGEMGAGRMSAPEAATWLRRVPGMNEDMLSMLSLSTAQFNALADAAKKAGTANEDSAKAGQLLTQAFTNIVLVIENGVPAFFAASASALNCAVESESIESMSSFIPGTRRSQVAASGALIRPAPISPAM